MFAGLFEKTYIVSSEGVEADGFVMSGHTRRLTLIRRRKESLLPLLGPGPFARRIPEAVAGARRFLRLAASLALTAWAGQ
ncbi:MAG: hypothetical protein FJX76_07675 [Armatimonadetes bacterium]|nr:hypothetical protein [Armatimonadota bacterium]